MPVVGGGGGPACFSKWDIGGCGCAATCSQTFTVTGCTLAYQGVTVSVYASNGGALLASGTTDVSGSVTLSWTGTNSPYVTITGQSTRFTAYGQVMTLTCGRSQTIALTPAAGYACGACLLPLATTLHLTDSIVGAVTLTYSGAQWSGTKAYAYPGCLASGCGAVASITLTYRFSSSGAGVGSFSGSVYGWVVGTVPHCPNFDGLGTNDQEAGGTAVGTCPPALNWTTTWTDTANYKLYCGATATITVTE